MNACAQTLEFLPAVLELEQTPPQPLGRAILWTIMSLFTIVVVWATIGFVDIVGTAAGKVVPDGRLKSVQALETGVVKEIFVAEGERVNAGDMLLMLDATQMNADLMRLRQERRGIHIEQIRLQSQLAALDRYKTPAAYFSRAATSPVLALDEGPYRASAPRVVEKLNEYFRSIARLDQERSRNRAERTVLQSRVGQLDATLPLLAERVAALKQLERRALSPRTLWLELREQMVHKETERTIVRAQFSSVDAEYESLNHERAVVTARMRSAWLSELYEIETRLQAVHQELLKAARRVAQRSLTAPVAGTVHELKVHTVGGVVSPAETLMYIIPAETALSIEAWISNKDIGFIHTGMPAEIKIETFPFTKYGVVKGEVSEISGDAVADEARGLVYRAQVRLEKSSIRVKNRLVSLAPGMAATVEINMGQRRIIEFILSPLLRYKDEGLQER